MNRRRVLFALGLFNAAVLMAAVMFLPRRTGYFFSYASQLERVIKHFQSGVPWSHVFAVVVISLLVSGGLYLLATARSPGESVGSDR